MVELRAAPFSLDKDDSVVAQIVSTNVYGDSAASSAGSGAVIWLVPDAPLNLQNVVSETNAQTIKVTWTDGLSDGGTPILDYSIWYDQSTGDWILLESSITSQ